VRPYKVRNGEHDTGILSCPVFPATFRSTQSDNDSLYLSPVRARPEKSVKIQACPRVELKKKIHVETSSRTRDLHRKETSGLSERVFTGLEAARVSSHVRHSLESWRNRRHRLSVEFSRSRTFPILGHAIRFPPALSLSALPRLSLSLSPRRLFCLLACDENCVYDSRTCVPNSQVRPGYRSDVFDIQDRP